jgi:hypothetical protein
MLFGAHLLFCWFCYDTAVMQSCRVQETPWLGPPAQGAVGHPEGFSCRTARPVGSQSCPNLLHCGRVAEVKAQGQG